jgi:O-antigen/teichoic acid export membrane protein
VVGGRVLLSWFWRRFKKARYLYLSEISSNFSFYIDRYVLAGTLDLKIAGIYTIYSSVGMALYNLVSSGVMQITRPKMVRAYAERDVVRFDELYKDCQHRALTFSVVLIGLSLCAFWFVFPHMDVTLNEHYGVFSFVLICVCMRVLADVKGYKLYTAKRDSVFMKTTVASVVVSATCNSLMVPYLGIWGAAYSFFITYFITYLVREYYLRRLELHK